MPSTLTAALADTVGVTDALRSGLVKQLTDTVGITDALKKGVRWHLTDTVGITDVVRAFRTTETVGITAALSIGGNLIQYDTWRPNPKPDNSLVLVCRTPESLHDSYAGLSRMTLWTVDPDGSNERPAFGTPESNGWTSYSHPEWSPDGNTVVIAVETPTEWKLILLDASGFGQ